MEENGGAGLDEVGEGHGEDLGVGGCRGCVRVGVGVGEGVVVDEGLRVVDGAIVGGNRPGRLVGSMSLRMMRGRATGDAPCCGPSNHWFTRLGEAMIANEEQEF